MGTIHDSGTGNQRILQSTTLVGRGPKANARLGARMVSSEHATISWRSGCWVLKDLGSRNGTFVNGKRLESGGSATLVPGTRLGFGHNHSDWEVLSIRAPRPMARLEGGEWTEGDLGLLSLPPDEPFAVVFPDDDGNWVLEQGGECTPISDGARVNIEGQPWELALPVAVPDTIDIGGERQLVTTKLVFDVSRDQETIAIRAVFPDGEEDLGARAHHAVLLQLARQRVADADEPEGEQGWLYSDDLCRMLGVKERAVDLHVHRARRALAALRVTRSAQLVARRPHNRQLRLGAVQFEIRETS